jgi:hypothetical protein
MIRERFVILLSELYVTDNWQLFGLFVPLVSRHTFENTSGRRVARKRTETHGDLGRWRHERSTQDIQGIQHRLCDHLDCPHCHWRGDWQDEYPAHRSLRHFGMGTRMDIRNNCEICLPTAKKVSGCRQVISGGLRLHEPKLALIWGRWRHEFD